MAPGSPSHGVNTSTSLVSPTISHASSSSFSELVVRSSDDSSVTPDGSSEDEVLWTGNELDSDDDFILVPQSRPVRTVPDSDVSTAAFAQLSLADPTTPTTPTSDLVRVHGASKSNHGVKGRRPAESLPRKPRGRRRRSKRDAAAASYPSPSPSPPLSLPPSPPPSLLREHAQRSIFGEHDSGFGERLVVEESDGDEPVVRRYEEAVRYITSFLASPTAAACTRLLFLQSLIIELGLIAPTSALPSSLNAAKRFLKARAFVNIGAYLSLRGQGLEQLRTAMYSSRRELTRDLRRSRSGQKADKGWVKRHGLNVLLVSVF